MRTDRTRTSAPEGLVTSPPCATWMTGLSPAIRGAVAVDVAARRVNAPSGGDDHARALRLLATVTAALSPSHVDDWAEHLRTSSGLVNATDPTTGRAIARAVEAVRVADFARRNGLADVDSIHDDALVERARRVAEVGLVHDAIVCYVEAQTCGESRRVSRAITESLPELRPVLGRIRSTVARVMDQYQHDGIDLLGRSRNFTGYAGAGNQWEDRRASLHAYWIGHHLAQTLAEILHNVPKNQRHAPPPKHDNEPTDEPIDAVQYGRDLWRRALVERPPLTRAHLGMLARTTRQRVNAGRVIVNPARLYTDPERRAFTRRGRGLGATVVVDCSGSMSLNVDDVLSLVEVAGGASVWAYRHHVGPSVYLLAHGGRMVETMPFLPGGSNGLDAPALRIAARYHDARTPFVWVTDGEYNGNGRQAPDVYLALDLLDIGRAARVVTLPTIGQAVAMLARVASGGHPDAPSLPTTVTDHASDAHLVAPHRPAWMPVTEIGTGQL